jgi:hypothetical protein
LDLQWSVKKKLIVNAVNRLSIVNAPNGSLTWCEVNFCVSWMGLGRLCLPAQIISIIFNPSWSLCSVLLLRSHLLAAHVKSASEIPLFPVKNFTLGQESFAKFAGVCCITISSQIRWKLILIVMHVGHLFLVYVYCFKCSIVIELSQESDFDFVFIFLLIT